MTDTHRVNLQHCVPYHAKMMDVSRLSSLNHTYEDIEGQDQTQIPDNRPPQPLLTFMSPSGGRNGHYHKKSNSDTDLLRLCHEELNIINDLIKGQKRPSVTQSNENHYNDVTFGLYGQIEEGFYKCHDSIYDVPEGQRIPDLIKKRLPDKKAEIEPKQTTDLAFMGNKRTNSKRRLSLDSGHGTSVADDETESQCLDSTFSSSMPSLVSLQKLENEEPIKRLPKRPKANDQQEVASRNYEELSMSDALDRICGTSSLQSLPGYRKSAPLPPPPGTPPPPLPPRLQRMRGGLLNLQVPPVPPPSTSKCLKPTLQNSLLWSSQEIPKGQKSPERPENNKRKLFKNPLKHKKARLLSNTSTSVSARLTPVKLLKLSSPFRISSNAKNNACLSSIPKLESPPSSTEKKMNLESLREAEIYGLPIIPFPYSEKKATPLNNHYLHSQRLIVTDLQQNPVTPRRKLRWDPTPNNVQKRLFFEESDEEAPQDLVATPLIVRALATPSGVRRHQLPVVRTEPEVKEHHCKTCTCNNQAILSRREMLSRVDNSRGEDLRNFQMRKSLRNRGETEVLSSRNYFPYSSEKRPRTPSVDSTASSSVSWNNNQVDYVEMSAKLV